MAGKIYASICSCMREIGVIEKGSVNKQQGYKYRGVDEIYKALQPALIKNNLFVVPEVLSQVREERQTAKGGNLIYSILNVKFTFYAEDGSSVSAVVTGEGMDSGDKASNKAMSVAFKYACFQVFCIPTEEMHDPDADTPPPSTPLNHAKSYPVEYIDEIKRATLMAELKRTGWNAREMLKYICGKFPANPPQDINHITIQQFTFIAKALAKRPDKS